MTPAIPKIVHRIWLGSKIPERFDAHWRTWQQMLPDHEFRTWDDQSVRALGMPAYFDGARTYAEQADIARLRILNTAGGIYTDCDIDLLRPLPTLWTRRDRLVVFEEPGPEWRGDRILNGCFAAAATQLRFVERYVEYRAGGLPPSAPPNERTGPEAFTRALSYEQVRNPRGMRIYPPSFLDLTGAASHAVIRTSFVEGGAWAPVSPPAVGPNGRRRITVAAHVAMLRTSRRVHD